MTALPVDEDPVAAFAARLGGNVRELRGHRELSRPELAVRAGLDPSTVAAVELGRRAPRADTAVRLAGALGVPVARVFIEIAWLSFPSGPGEFLFPSREEWRKEALRRAAEVRSGQTEVVELVQLISEGREERAEQIERALRGDS